MHSLAALTSNPKYVALIQDGYLMRTVGNLVVFGMEFEVESTVVDVSRDTSTTVLSTSNSMPNTTKFPTVRIKYPSCIRATYFGFDVSAASECMQNEDIASAAVACHSNTRCTHA